MRTRKGKVDERVNRVEEEGERRAEVGKEEEEEEEEEGRKMSRRRIERDIRDA